jgi:hypothetical protein
VLYGAAGYVKAAMVLPHFLPFGANDGLIHADEFFNRRS